MLGIGRPKALPVDEQDARGEIERVYHDAKQTLRTSGISLNLRTWAGHEAFFPAIWDALRPNLETRAFEDAGDRLRAAAVQAASRLGHLDALSSVRLGESQAIQVQWALDLYHYINPKLLVLTSLARLTLDGDKLSGRNDAPADLIERGVPARMYPMEMIDEEPDDRRLRDMFHDVRRAYSAPSISNEFRTLGLWPDYLLTAWQRLKPIIVREPFAKASLELKEMARDQARALPYPVVLPRERLGQEADEVHHAVLQFEQLLPSLIMTVALLHLDFRPPDVLAQSPFPAAPRQVIDQREAIRQGGGR